MSYAGSPYFHVGKATELSGKDYRIYRALEILPGFLSWGTLFGIIALSAYVPVYAAVLIIIFDIYWVLKTFFLSIHLRQNWRRMKHNLGLNWAKRLNNLRHDHITHLVLLPFYNEESSVVGKSIQALVDSKGDKKQMSVVLAAEESAGESAKKLADNLMAQYGHIFGHFLVTVHPKDVSGEMRGKGSNIAYAAEQARIHILDKHNIRYEDALVSAFDIDTVVYPQYFMCLTWHFLTAEKPLKSSFQPVPLYNNNIWQANALSRVVATAGTFWQMIQQERPERLATFSSHSVSFKALYDVGYWQKNMVSEDSRIFWNLYMANDGDYTVVPLSYPISMDANLAKNFFRTASNIYKQQRRWTWGVENVSYILFSFIKNKNIAFRRKLNMGFVQIEGFWSLATNPLIIFLLGWLPLALGGPEFNKTILSYNLPIITRNLMLIAMSGLIFSSIISFSFLPKPPKEKRTFRYKLYLLLQWALVPFTMTFFGAIPGLDAQTRLMFGKYMGFWVTPKHRKTP